MTKKQQRGESYLSKDPENLMNRRPPLHRGEEGAERREAGGVLGRERQSTGVGRRVRQRLKITCV